MFNSRISSIIRKEFLQLFRDPRTLALAVVIPIVQLFLLGYAATSDVRNIPMAVWDQSKTPQSRQLLDAFRAADYFTIDYFVGSTDEYQKLIESGDARVALVIPAEYIHPKKFGVRVAADFGLWLKQIAELLESGAYVPTPAGYSLQPRE